MITFKLFDNVYRLIVKDKDKDFLEHFISTKPTLNEFEDFCWSWKIDYEIHIIAKNEIT